MITKLRNAMKKHRRKQFFKEIAPYANLNANTRYGDSFQVVLRQPVTGREFASVGEHGIIDAQLIFEKDSGHIQIGDRCLISGFIISVNDISIGDDVIIAWDTIVYDHNSHSVNWEERKEDTRDEYLNFLKYGDPVANKNWSVVKSAPIRICDKVWIGTGCKILKGVTIGEGAVVAAGSVVTKDVEPWTVVGGNPARIIKKLQRNIEDEQ